MRTHISLRKPTSGRLITLGARWAWEISVGGKSIWVISYNSSVNLSGIKAKFRRQLNTNDEILGVACWDSLSEEWEHLPTEAEREEMPF